MSTEKLRSETTVSIPKELKTRFDRLPKNWLNFADFCREAIRDKLTQEERLLKWVPEGEAGDDPPRTQQDTHHKGSPH